MAMGKRKRDRQYRGGTDGITEVKQFRASRIIKILKPVSKAKQ